MQLLALWTCTVLPVAWHDFCKMWTVLQCGCDTAPSVKLQSLLEEDTIIVRFVCPGRISC